MMLSEPKIRVGEPKVHVGNARFALLGVMPYAL